VARLVKRIDPHLAVELTDEEYVGYWFKLRGSTIEVLTDVDIIWLPRVIVGCLQKTTHQGVVVWVMADDTTSVREVPWERILGLTIMPEYAPHYEDDRRRV
jgi:hypothetical protein